ncbi:DUF4870 domain-containing protein [Kangiella sp. HZ709]|uniref:DUF4870 domain-containing protein n=1 Tax=Kangiella sp. HZ709 TaxID=2666328 RepID=UPI0012B11D20|nr:DUF4870 domain-containing protein [Kangiella sp. HZ709]MRX27989.1 DUF4870 domain-containing protein [Kangiella sp. HZ709]
MSEKDKKETSAEETTEKVDKVEEVVEEARPESTKAESSQAKTEAPYERVIEGEAEVLGAESATSDEKSWSMFTHLAAFVAMVPLIPVIGMVLGPLVVWLLKKESMPLVAENGKEALNFNISMFIAYCVALILSIILIGIPLLIGLIIFHFIVTIIAAIKASEGGVYKYPFSLKLIQ